MATNSLDILIRYLLDKQALGETSKGSDKVASDLTDIQKVATALDRTFEHLEKQMKEATSIKEIEHLERQLKDVEDQVNETTRAYRLQARVLRAEAAAITDDFAKARVSQLKNISGQLGGLSQAGLGLGLGLTGGIFAFASKYVKDATEATEVTREWEAAQASLGRSGSRIGAVMAQEALPLLRDAAELADNAAGFIEDHPDIIRAALNFGMIVTGLSAVGLAASKGIALYADTKALLLGSQEIAAAKLQDTAADKQLAAAQLQARLQGIDVDDVPNPKNVPSGAGGAVALAGSVAVAVLATAAVAGAVKLLVREIVPDEGEIKGPITSNTFGRGNPDFTRIQGELAEAERTGADPEKIAQLREELHALGRQSLETSQDINKATDEISQSSARSFSVSESPAFEKILEAYEDYKKEDLALVQEHYAERQSIITDALNSELAAAQRLSDGISKVNAREQKSLEDAAANFARIDSRAEEKYQQRRAEIIRDGNREVEQLRQDSQERLAELEQEHLDRRSDIINRRDALALAREDRQHERAVNDEHAQLAQEIRERRQQIAQRLADLRQSYEEERAQRLADYQAKIAEIQENAKAQREELNAQHQAELQQIRIQKAAKLRELDTQFAQERQRRYQYFIQQVRDLDAYLLGERNTTARYRALMLQDLERFLAQERALRTSAQGGTTVSAGTTGSRAYGGYASYGKYMLGDRPGGGPGKREYVIDGDSTSMLERLMGSQITPERLMAAAIYGGGGTSKIINYNDQRTRMDARMSGAERNRLMSDSIEAMQRSIGMMG